MTDNFSITLAQQLRHASRRLGPVPQQLGRRRVGRPLLVALAALSISGAAFAATSTSLLWSHPKDEPVVHKLGPKQGNLKALHQRGHRLPRKLQAEIRHVTVAGENPALGRKVLTTSFGFNYYIVPAANGKICLETDGSAACTFRSQIPTGTFSGTIACVGNDGSWVMEGMLPERSTAVRLEFPDGQTRHLPISFGVYSVKLTRDSPYPTRVLWTVAGHRRSVAAPVDRQIRSHTLHCAGEKP